MFDLLAFLNLSHITHLTHFMDTFVSNDWSIDQLLKNANKNAKKWGGLFFGLLGTVCFLWGGGHFGAVVFSKQGKGRFAWLGILALIIGGLLAYGGFSMFVEMSQGGLDSVRDLGK